MLTTDENKKATRGHCLKLRKTRCTRDITRHFFSTRLVNRWNLLDKQTVDAPSLNAFKNRLSLIATTGRASSWTSPLSSRPRWGGEVPPGRPHKVNHKVNQVGETSKP